MLAVGWPNDGMQRHNSQKWQRTSLYSHHAGPAHPPWLARRPEMFRARLLIDSSLIDGKIVIHIFFTHFMFSFTLEKCFNSKRCVCVTACFTGLRIIITSTLLSCSLLSCALCHPEAGVAHRMQTVGVSLTLAAYYRQNSPPLPLSPDTVLHLCCIFVALPETIVD